MTNVRPHQMKPRSAYPPFPRWSFPVLKYRILDGDTSEVYLQKWTDEVKNTNIRVTGADTPELHDARQREAALVCQRAFIHWVEQYGPLDRLQVEILEDDKYGGRMIGDFFDRAHPNAMRFSEWMLHEGFAKVYTGETKEEWTDEQLAAIIARGQVNFPPGKKSAVGRVRGFKLPRRKKAKTKKPRKK